MTLMECARKVCYLLGIDGNDINEIYFVERKVIKKENRIKGVVIRTSFLIIIVPDLNNMEYILQYDSDQTEDDIIHDLVDVHQFAQRDVARILRYCQGTISRKIKNKKEVKEDEKGGIDQKDQNMH